MQEIGPEQIPPENTNRQYRKARRRNFEVKPTWDNPKITQFFKHITFKIQNTPIFGTSGKSTPDTNNYISTFAATSGNHQSQHNSNENAIENLATNHSLGTKGLYWRTVDKSRK